MRLAREAERGLWPLCWGRAGDHLGLPLRCWVRHTHTLTWIYAYTCACPYMHTYTHVCEFTQTCTRPYAYTRLHTYTHDTVENLFQLDACWTLWWTRCSVEVKSKHFSFNIFMFKRSSFLSPELYCPSNVLLTIKEIRSKGKHLVRMPLVQPNTLWIPQCFLACLLQMEMYFDKTPVLSHSVFSCFADYSQNYPCYQPEFNPTEQDFLIYFVV